MLYMESPHQGIYAPLSQAMTDSESEEEIHNTSKQIQQKQQQQNRRNPPNTLSLKLPPQRQHQKFQINSHTSITLGQSQPPSSYTTNMQNTFRSVMMSDGAHCDPGFSNSFASDYENNGDNIAILGSSSDSNSASEKMSTSRRFCFIASLLLCVFAVFGFVWLVPCSEGSICPSPVDRIKTHNWLNNYTTFELKGGVNIVNGLRKWENNLIFLYRGDAFFPEFSAKNTKHNGIISLIGSSGAVAWYDEMVDEPVAIDCTLIDVDRNGRSDCLVVDEYGALGAINPISGQWHWRFKERRSAHKVDALSFPVILPDLDGDGVLDILIVTSAGWSLDQTTKDKMRKGDASRMDERNFLRILSGNSGKPIGEGFKIHDCEVLRKLQLESAQTVTFNCVFNNTEAQRSKTLSELFALITNYQSIAGQKLEPVSKISQHRHYGQRKDIDAQRNIYSLSGRELVVENRGKCPDDCNVTLILSESRNGKTNILRNFTNTGFYGMVPAQWHFKNTKTKMSGFVMKFWKWNNLKNIQNETNPNENYTFEKSPIVKKAQETVDKSDATKSTKQSQTHSSNRTRKNRRKRDKEFPKNEFNVFDNLVHKRRNTYTMSVKDANVTKQKRGGNLLLDNYQMQMITETVILVLFYGADTRIENTSQSNIVQFCRQERSELVCQPDLNNQENSMLIADLDEDGSQELISYMTTFVKSNDDDWKLVTYVRLLRLQSELPAFYDKEMTRN